MKNKRTDDTEDAPLDESGSPEPPDNEVVTFSSQTEIDILTDSKMDSQIGFNVDNLFTEEIKKAENLFLSRFSDLDERNSGYLRETIYKRFIGEIENTDIHSLCSALLNLLELVPIKNSSGHQLFVDIVNKLQRRLDNELSANKPDSEFAAFQIRQIEIAANVYCRNIILQEVKDFDLPKKLQCIKRAILARHSNILRYRHQALLDLREGLEKEIELQKEAAELRNQLKAEPIEDVEESPDEIIKQGKQQEVFFALRILLSSLSGSQTDKANFMSFVSGFGAGELGKSFSPSKVAKMVKPVDSLKRAIDELKKITPLNRRMNTEIEEIKKQL
jgi:predicted component of type VI protein secretion system